MKLTQAIQSLGLQQSLDIAAQFAEEQGLDWQNDIYFVFSAVAQDPDRIPNNIAGETEGQAIDEWLRRYKRGYDSRVSQRASRVPSTIADPIIEKIIGARLVNLDERGLAKVIHAHRLAMSAENILGHLLEEYLAINLKSYGWHCAWGETIRSVDFVSKHGELLQIKNRSNSENSSSSAIRERTQISKWYRVKADRIEYKWNSLNELCNTQHLSEDGFVKFTLNCIRENPRCLAVEFDNSWQQD